MVDSMTRPPRREGGEGTGPSEAGTRGKGSGHFGGDPGRLWPPPKWPGPGGTGEGAYSVRVSPRRRRRCVIGAGLAEKTGGRSREGVGDTAGTSRSARGRCGFLRRHEHVTTL